MVLDGAEGRTKVGRCAQGSGPLGTWGTMRRVGTESGLGEEAVCCLCLLAAGQALHRRDRQSCDGLSPVGSPVPFEISRELGVFLFFQMVSWIWVFLVATERRQSRRPEAEHSDTCWLVYR